MNIFTIIVSVLVALEFFFIMYLETFATTSDKTAKAFGMTYDDLQNVKIQSLFKNQGVYNGLIGLGILYSLFIVGSSSMLGMILVYIVGVAVYGSFTVDKSIVFKQGGLAILALITMLL
ncbi:DUF1304 domain-containing protein [Weissella viridescens]